MAKSPYAELPEPLNTHLPALFKSYSELRVEKPSSWFAWTKDKVVSNILCICHANMCYDGAGYDNLITAVPQSDGLSLEYLRMLIRGPFRSYSDLIKLDRFGNDYFLHLLSLDKWPANVLMNFCIASRVPIELKSFLTPWANRCDEGFDPVLAFLLVYKSKNFSIPGPDHLWFDPGSSWSNILCGTFQSVSRPFKTHPQDSRPTNLIWGHSDDYKKLLTMSDVEIAEFYKQPIQILEPPEPPKVKIAKIKNAPNYFGDQLLAYQQAAIAPNQWAAIQAVPQPPVGYQQPEPPDEEAWPIHIEEDEDDIAF